MGERARVGPDAMVGANAVIEADAVVGPGARVEPGATVSGGFGGLVNLDKTALRASTRAGMLGDVLAQPLQLGDALWRARVGRHPPARFARRARGVRYGRLRDRRGPRYGRAWRSRDAADHRCARVCARVVDPAGVARPVRQLLGRHRGDARLLRGRWRRGHAARGAHHRRHARRGWPARRACP